jgi:opacity protein-like surface antigen
MTRSSSTLAALMSLAGTVAASAQQLPPARFGIGAGITSPRGAYHANQLGEGFNSGWQGMGFLEFRRANHPLGVRVDVVIGENPANDQLNANAGATVKMRMFGGDVDLIYNFGQVATRIRAYVLGGVGRFSITRSSQSGGIAAPDQSESKFGWNAGAGVMFPVRLGAFFLEARYFEISNSFVSSGNAPFVVATAGFRFRR